MEAKKLLTGGYREVFAEIKKVQEQLETEIKALAKAEGRLFKENKRIQKERVQKGVAAYFKLVDRYEGDYQLVLGLLLPFPMKSWPAVERILSRYGSKASVTSVGELK